VVAGETRYELLEPIGTGRYATVYRARDNQLGREVAIKKIHDEFLSGSTQLGRYWHEAQLLASLQHPNIVTIYDIDRDCGWLVMELMQSTLADRMTGRQMDLRALRTAVAHCLRALHYLHERGVVHGDIKPSNMMIDSRRRIKIGDFGLARRVSDHDGTLLKGSTRYIAPEVVSEDFGDVDSSSDLYSLGFAAYELMCGPPFEELALGLGALRSNTAGEDPWIEWHAAPDRRLPLISQVLEGVPDDLSQVIQTLTEKDKSRRYTTAADALSDLKVDLKIIRNDRSNDTDAKSGDDDEPTSNRRRTVAIAAACASILLSLVLVLAPGRDNPTPKPGDTVASVFILEQIDDAAGTLRVRALDTGVESRLKLSEDVHVLIEQGPDSKEHGQLSDLEPGDRVDLSRTSGEDSRVVEVTAAHPTPDGGLIKTIDVPGSRLVLASQDGDNRDDVDLRIAIGTRFRLNGQRGDLLDVQPGDNVTAIHIRDAGNSGNRLAVEVSVRRATTTVALISKTDPASRRLTLQYQRGNSSPDFQTRTVADNVEIAGRGDAAAGQAKWTLEAITPGMLVVVTHEESITALTVTKARQPLIRASIDSLDSASGRVSIKSTGGTKNLKLTDDTLVFLNSRPAQLEDLRADDTVWVSAEPGGGRALLVAAERGGFPHRWSLLIGTSRYSDRSLTPLPFAGGDLKLVADHLSWFYRVPDDDTHALSLIDTPRETLKQAVIDFLAKQQGRTELVVYITGHAYKADDGKTWLAPPGFDWDNMAETGISLEWLVRQIEDCRAGQKLLLLDCTHDGSGRDLEKEPSGEALLKPLKTLLKTTTTIASCGEGQRGMRDTQRRHGLFAWYVAAGYRGGADVDVDGIVTGRELFEFVREGLGRDSRRLGGKQVPVQAGPR
jgi:serine/threonine-protein kinase